MTRTPSLVRSRGKPPALLALLAVAPLVAPLAGCGGGGGGGGSPTTSVVTTTPTTPTPSPPAPTIPSTSSAEYQRGWNLAAIHADVAYGKGATGQGITVAVVDSGVDATQADLVGAVSSDSTDIIGRGVLVGSSRHGTQVAGIIAARFNGAGAIGVAYNSTILSIRADDSRVATTDCPDCVFDDADLAKALDYAVSKGAKVINLSLGGEGPLGSGFEAALSRATAAGAVVAISAGNESAADPAWPARYATDSRYAGAVVAVGSLNRSGVLSSFSNKAGASANGYLAAPGESIATECDTSGCSIVSGTSFAAPQVAGALALLLQYFPNISGRDAVDILLRTADDLGTTGTDTTYGRGGLDLTRAFEPVGTSSLSLANGTTTALAGSGVGATVAAAFGTALRRGDGLRTTIRDDYHRLFVVNLADGLPGQRRPAAVVAAPPVQDSSQVVVGGPQLGGLNLAVSVEAPVFDDRANEPEASRLVGDQPMRSVRMQATYGRLSLTNWSGEGGPAPAGPAGRDAFQTIARPDRATQAAVRLGRFALLAEQGSAHPRRPLQAVEIDGSSYASATGMMEVGRALFSVTGGALDEPLGPLGSYLEPGSTLALPARTRFGAAAVDYYPRPGVSLHADLSMGRTEVQGGLLSLDRAVSSAWTLQAGADCRLVGWTCSRLTFGVAQPLRIESGKFTATLADVPAAYDDPLTFSARRIDATPDGREIDLSLGLEQAFGPLRSLVVRAALALQPGHQADAPPAAGAVATWRSRF